MINDIFVYVEAYSITNGFSLLDDNYLSTATLWEKMGQTMEWDVYSGKEMVTSKELYICSFILW